MLHAWEFLPFLVALLNRDSNTSILTVKTPDTMADWTMTAFAVHPTTGLSVASTPEQVMGFRWNGHEVFLRKESKDALFVSFFHAEKKMQMYEVTSPFNNLKQNEAHFAVHPQGMSVSRTPEVTFRCNVQ